MSGHKQQLQGLLRLLPLLRHRCGSSNYCRALFLLQTHAHDCNTVDKITVSSTDGGTAVVGGGALFQNEQFHLEKSDPLQARLISAFNVRGHLGGHQSAQMLSAADAN